MKNCPGCGKPIIDQFVYCPFCGNEIEPKCKNCGEPLLEGAHFCANCGAKVGGVPAKNQVQEQTLVAATKKANKTKINVPKSSIIALAKCSLVVLVCVLAFAFSFAGVTAFKTDALIEQMFPTISTSGYSIKGADITLNSVDYIAIMFASAHHYDPDEDADKIEKMEDELAELQEEFASCLEQDVRVSGIVLSSETNRVLHKYYVCTLKYMVSVESTGATLATFASSGALLFINIFVTALMIAFAIVELVKKIRAVIKGEEVKILSKLDTFLPMLIALPVAAILAIAPLGSYVSLAGTLITGLVFSSIAIVAVLAISMIENVKKHNSINVIIPKIITIALCVVVLGCCFAPVLKATFNITTSDATRAKDYTIDLYADVFAGGLVTDAQKEVVKNNSVLSTQYYYYTEAIKSTMAILPSLSKQELLMADSAVLNSVANSVIAYSCLAQVKDAASGAFSAGYFLLIVVVLLCGGAIGAAIGDDRRSQVCCNVFIVFALLIALGISIALPYIVDYQLGTMNRDDLSLSLGGGVISAIVMGVIALVFSAISQQAWTKKKEELILDEQSAETEISAQ